MVVDIMNGIRTRVNKKTGKTEYKARYYWRDETDKRRDSETGWMDTPDKARKEAEKLKIYKEEMARVNIRLDGKVKMTVESAMSQWIEELREKAYRETMDNTTSDVTLYKRARTLLKTYTPNSIKAMKIYDMDAIVYRKWMTEINKKKLSGNTVRHYRQTMRAFNKYLADNGYYKNSKTDLDVDIALSRTSIKPKKAMARKRYCPTISDIKKICDVYIERVDEFEYLYWYTLFMVLFYSGMRVEELIGLQWKSVYLDVERPYIDIINAISERELKENVMNRISANIYNTKNEKSQREIPILNYYGDLIQSYKTKYMEYYDNDSIDDCFVFPNINALHEEDRASYQKQKNILRELNRAVEASGVPKTDCQMFRHACATWLVTDEKHGGVGMTESEAKDYFGHTSDEMLSEVYTKLDKRQRANRTSETFSSISKVNKHYKESEKYQSDIEQTKRVIDERANAREKYDSIVTRIVNELIRCYKTKEKQYHTNELDFFYADDAMSILEEYPSYENIRNELGIVMYNDTDITKFKNAFDEYSKIKKMLEEEEKEKSE